MTSSRTLLRRALVVGASALIGSFAALALAAPASAATGDGNDDLNPWTSADKADKKGDYHKDPKLDIKAEANCDTTTGKYQITFTIDQDNVSYKWFYRFKEIELKADGQKLSLSKLDPQPVVTPKGYYPYSVKDKVPFTTTLMLDGDFEGKVSLDATVVWAKKVKFNDPPPTKSPLEEIDSRDKIALDGIGKDHYYWLWAGQDDDYEAVELDGECKPATTTTTTTTITPPPSTLPVTGEGNIGGLVGTGAGMIGLGIAAFATIFVLRRRRDRVAES